MYMRMRACYHTKQTYHQHQQCLSCVHMFSVAAVPSGVFGAYLLAIYDDENECYQTISKLGTGFSEEQLVQLADSLRPAIIPAPRKYYQVTHSRVSQHPVLL